MNKLQIAKKLTAIVPCPRCNGDGTLCLGCCGVGMEPQDDLKGVYFDSCGITADCSVCDGLGKVPIGTRCLDVNTRKMVVAGA